MLDKLPNDFNVGLRVYGHRQPSTSPKTCTDSELVLPIRKLDRAAVMAAANRVKPRGETPLVYSVLQSPGDLKAVGAGTVIVITDGEESCGGDPKAAVTKLAESDVDVTLNIVGFTLNSKKVESQLSAFSEAAGRALLQREERRRAGARAADRGGREVPLHDSRCVGPAGGER